MSSIEDYVRDNVTTTEDTSALALGLSPQVLRLDKSAYSLVDSNREISLALAKRFKGKKTAYGVPNYTDLLKWCLASDSYKVCEENVKDISDKNVESIWEFIDTMSVSSTRQCRDSIEKFKSNRSVVGFRRALDRTGVRERNRRRDAKRSSETSVRESGYMPQPIGSMGEEFYCSLATLSGGSKHIACSPRLPRNAVPPVLAITRTQYGEEHESLADLIASECSEWLELSEDPLALALRFREQISELD